jgi:putative heme-binding domain-containing protein
MWLLLLLAFQTGDLEQGKRWYDTQCASCHGVRGDGGRGANLATPRLRRAPDEEALIRVITRGIPGTEMPRAPLTAQQVRQVAAYVRTLGQTAVAVTSGDAARGERIFLGKGGCRECHTVGGEGGVLGPDLTEIGARSSPGYLRISLTEPGAATYPAYRHVRVVTADGSQVEGVRINEDTFSIRMWDLKGRLHTFWKSELKSLAEDRQTVMPSYKGRLSDSEIEDLLAYLGGLR